jgi:exportin-2 (importin alpha re-exporter)
LKNKNFQISVDIYDIIFQIIKRYRYEFKSYALFEEIKATISEIAPAMTEDGITCINFFFSDEKSNREMCILYLTLIKHIINIFISLNFQDFPEFFEDNLKSWIGILKGSLDFSMGIPSNDRVLNSLFIKVKKVAMKALNLYCNNYYEDIIQSHNDFLPSVWNLLNLIKHDETYAKLIREILDYYKILFQYKRTVGFESSTIQHLINNLIIPEMRMTNKEMDDFEDNPINFLKIELEEADMDSSKYLNNFRQVSCNKFTKKFD